MRTLNILILLTLLLFIGCHDDKGNYDYTELNEPLVEDMNYRYDLTFGDPLEIHPKLTFPGEQSLDVNYFWYLGDSLVCTEKDLVIESFTLRSGWVTANFIVEEAQTGIRYMNPFNISVSAPYETGWLILMDEGGKSKLAMIRENFQEEESGAITVVYKEIVDINSSTELGSTPRRLVEHWAGKYSSVGLGEILVMNGTGDSYELSGEDLTPILKTIQEFNGEVYPAGFSPVDALYVTHFSFLLSEDGKLYFRQNMDPEAFHTGTYSTTPMEGPQNMELGFFIPSIYNKTSQGLFYDKHNRRYLLWADSYQDFDPNDMGFLSRLDMVKKYPEGFSDLDDLKMDVVLVGSCDPYYDESVYFAILKSDEGKYYMQQFSAKCWYGSISATPDFQSEFPLANQLKEDSKMALTKDSKYVFISSDNKLYYASRAAKDKMVFHEYEAYLGGKIVQMRPVVTEDTGERLGVVDENGKFYVLDLSVQVMNNGGKVLYESQNRFGKVVDMIYKYGDRNLWAIGW